MTADELKALVEAAKKAGANVDLSGLPPGVKAIIDGDVENVNSRKHQLSDEAQEANLVSAWSQYSKPKEFKEGDILRESPGITTFNDDPILLFVRYMGEDYQDKLLVKAFLNQRAPENKLDCVLMRTDYNGCSYFIPHDSHRLIPYVPA